MESLLREVLVQKCSRIYSAGVESCGLGPLRFEMRVRERIVRLSYLAYAPCTRHKAIVAGTV